MDKEVECMQSYTNNYIGKNSYRYCYQALTGLFQANHTANFEPLDYSLDGDHPDDSRLQGSSENGTEMVDYMLSNSSVPQTQISLDKLSFADVMQFADFGPKLAVLNQSKMSEDENYHALLPLPALPAGEIEDGLGGTSIKNKEVVIMEDRDGSEKGRLTSENITSQQLHLVDGVEKTGTVEVKSRRKRPRSMKTSEEVESQRMTHIAVERNRRRQMNEHLRVLRSLMPGSYVQRGDQASIIGGAIEFVRELEQLVSCLESQKRRRLHASTEAQRTDSTPSTVPIQQTFYPYLPLPDSDNAKLLDLHQGSGFREEMAENKSYLADIEVRLLGLDAVIKILSRRRPGQLIKTIAALEELQLSILHTNITTIEQTVLYSFNIKITGEARYTAEDMANSVQRILSFIDANTL